MISNNIYHEYLKQLERKNTHAILLPRVFREYISSHLSPLFQQTLYAPSAADHVIILGGYNDLAETYALYDYLISSEDNNENISTPIFNVISFNEPSKESILQSQTRNNPKIRHHSILSFFATPTQEELRETIEHTRIFIFGNIFSSLARHKATTPGTYNTIILQFLGILFQYSQGGSCFVFIDMPQSSNKKDDQNISSKEEGLDIRKHVEKALTKFGGVSSGAGWILSASEQVVVKSEGYGQQFFNVWKAAGFKLPESFYSTVSYIRAQVISSCSRHAGEIDGMNVVQDSRESVRDVMERTNHNDVLNIGTLIRSSKYTDEYLEMDEAAAAKYLKTIRELSKCGLLYGSLETIEVAMKRCILIEWFLKMRTQYPD